ncbi:MAG: group III truncated hemoglobin [Acidimicrobiia bacterium]
MSGFDEADIGGDPVCWAHLFERADIVDRHDIERLVRTFYRAAAMDDVLGPVFGAAHVDWPAHIDTLTRFWSWQLLGEREYDGNPLKAHQPVHVRTPFTEAHYERWLDLFTSTVDELFEGTIAEHAKGRARKMAKALRRLLDGEAFAGDAPGTPVWLKRL